MAASGSVEDGGRREVGVTLKGRHEESLWCGNVLCLDYIDVKIWAVVCTTVLQKLPLGENQAKGTQDLSVLILATACDSVIIWKLKFQF